jgi:hypothetical protein
MLIGKEWKNDSKNDLAIGKENIYNGRSANTDKLSAKQPTDVHDVIFCNLKRSAEKVGLLSV